MSFLSPNLESYMAFLFKILIQKRPLSTDGAIWVFKYFIKKKKFPINKKLNMIPKVDILVSST